MRDFNLLPERLKRAVPEWEAVRERVRDNQPCVDEVEAWFDRLYDDGENSDARTAVLLLVLVLETGIEHREQGARAVGFQPVDHDTDEMMSNPRGRAAVIVTRAVIAAVNTLTADEPLGHLSMLGPEDIEPAIGFALRAYHQALTNKSPDRGTLTVRLS